MTLNDLLKRINIEESKDKMILYSDGNGWANTWFEENETQIIIKVDEENSKPVLNDLQISLKEIEKRFYNLYHSLFKENRDYKILAEKRVKRLMDENELLMTLCMRYEKENEHLKRISE